jgi:hypothetical protein
VPSTVASAGGVLLRDRGAEALWRTATRFFVAAVGRLVDVGVDGVLVDVDFTDCVVVAKPPVSSANDAPGPASNRPQPTVAVAVATHARGVNPMKQPPL